MAKIEKPSNNISATDVGLLLLRNMAFAAAGYALNIENPGALVGCLGVGILVLACEKKNSQWGAIFSVPCAIGFGYTLGAESVSIVIKLIGGFFAASTTGLNVLTANERSQQWE